MMKVAYAALGFVVFVAVVVAVALFILVIITEPTP